MVSFCLIMVFDFLGHNHVLSRVFVMDACFLAKDLGTIIKLIALWWTLRYPQLLCLHFRLLIIILRI